MTRLPPSRSLGLAPTSAPPGLPLRRRALPWRTRCARAGRGERASAASRQLGALPRLTHRSGVLAGRSAGGRSRGNRRGPSWGPWSSARAARGVLGAPSSRPPNSCRDLPRPHAREMQPAPAGAPPHRPWKARRVPPARSPRREIEGVGMRASGAGLPGAPGFRR